MGYLRSLKLVPYPVENIRFTPENYRQFGLGIPAEKCQQLPQLVLNSTAAMRTLQNLEARTTI